VKSWCLVKHRTTSRFLYLTLLVEVDVRFRCLADLSPERGPRYPLCGGHSRSGRGGSGEKKKSVSLSGILGA
jgi:hypothetical protein